MAEISLILPSYNVGHYIEKCLKSVVNQTFSDLEILCIDAGSNDGTLEILKEYAQKDKRIQVILSEKKSYGYQVNKGIAIAGGEYIGIVETDDYIEADMYQSLYDVMKQEPVDFVKGMEMYYYELGNDCSYHLPRKGILRKLFSDGTQIVTIKSQHYPEILWQDYHLWNGLYDAQLLKTISLNETPGAAYQDTGFLFQLYVKANTGKFINQAVYHYRRTNKEASAYDTSSIKNILYEYKAIFQNKDHYDEKWLRAASIKCFIQIRKKLYYMGFQGQYWDESNEAIQEMRDLIGTHSNSEDCPPKYRSDMELFIHDPRELYERFDKTLSYKKRIVSELFSFSSKREFSILGAAEAGHFVMTLLLSHGYLPVGVCDNSIDKLGQEFLSYKIVTPKEMLIEDPEMRFVVATQKDETAAQIKKQLLELGVKSEDVFAYSAGLDSVLLLV